MVSNFQLFFSMSNRMSDVSYSINLFLLAEKCVHCSFNLSLFLLPVIYHLLKTIGLVYKSDVGAGCNMCCD
jgi:hypothetical protein